VNTFNGGAFGQYSDCTHCYILELVDGAALGPPTVRSNPQEMAHLIGPLGGIEHSPARAFICLIGESTRGMCNLISIT